jgi:hypothetical protein
MEMEADAAHATTYTTLDGRVLDLTGLPDEERIFLARCYAAYRAGVSWEEFIALARGAGNPLVRAAGGRITQGVWDHPLFQAVHDLEDRLGILQGEFTPDPGDDVSRGPFTDKRIPAVAAQAS